MVVVALLTSLGSLAGLEGYARWKHLDLLQASGVQLRRELSDIRPRVMDKVDLQDLDYLPIGFEIRDGQIHSRFGTCQLDRPQPTLLALGDSVSTLSTFRPPATELQNTWAPQVAGALREQLCIFAELGYHPSDSAAFVEAIGSRLQPSQTVLVLCENDLRDQLPRHVVQDGRGWSLVPEPAAYAVHPSTWWPWLGRRSEAYRFLSYRLALATQQQMFWNRERAEHRPASEALRQLAHLHPLVVYVPNLTADWRRLPEVDQLAADSGVAILTMPRPADPLALRREPRDEVHLNERGHQLLAEAILETLSR